jgi:aspartyl-tRNA(Asn)/glutamyl-tRNA(Gln) amidotransferase subunit A
MTRRTFVSLSLFAAALAFSPLPFARTAAAGDLTSLTLAEAAAKVRSGAVTSVALTEACLARIAIYDPKLNAYITVMKSQALAQARALDAEAKAGKFRGPLHGVPVALKDNIDAAGARTTAGSGVFEDRFTTEDAPVVARLKAAGAVIIGKLNLHEFAMGIGESSYFGPPRNPWNLAHNTGGSSSGSGAAVAAELCYGALGTDTGGSIRIPASFCGIVGFKATYGLVPIRGIAPLTVSLDHCGPMTRTVEDAALMLTAMAGYDKLDTTSVEHLKEDYVAALSQPVSGFRLGMPAYYYDHLDPEVDAAIKTALGVLAKLTKEIKDVSLPSITTAASVGGAGETYAYHEEYYKKVPNRYTPAVRRRLEASSKSTLTPGEYIRAKWSLDLLRRTVDDAFTDFDLVVLPTERVQPPLLNDLLKSARDGSVGATADVVSNTSPFNVYGLPAISIPCGFTKAGFPVGLTIAGPRFSEGRILALAQAYERATEWHNRRPPLTPETPVPPLNGG